MGDIITRALSSLRHRGIVGSISTAITIWQDRYFDMRYGTDTFQQVYLDSVTIHDGSRAHGCRYGASRVRSFKKLMRELRLAEKGTFVDFGSGKGRTLLLAAQCGFKSVVGVEFAMEFCAIARNNIAVFKKKQGRIDADIRLVEGDAAKYEVQDTDNVFYFYNPFDSLIMERVMHNICKSLDRHQRQVFIVYSLPRFREIIDQHAIFFLLGEYEYWDTKFLVYTNK